MNYDMHINLLPWREQERKQKKIRFGLSIISTILLAIIMIIVLHIYFRYLIGYQQQRNKYLQAVIDQERIYLKVLNKQKQHLTIIDNDLNFIIGLRDSSYDAVRILDTLAKVVPDGVSFLSVVRDGKGIVINGIAKSDLQVTQFMENITKSEIFQQPILTSISSRTTNQGEQRQFQINVDAKGSSP